MRARSQGSARKFDSDARLRGRGSRSRRPGGHVRAAFVAPTQIPMEERHPMAELKEGERLEKHVVFVSCWPVAVKRRAVWIIGSSGKPSLVFGVILADG